MALLRREICNHFTATATPLLPYAVLGNVLYVLAPFEGTAGLRLVSSWGRRESMRRLGTTPHKPSQLGVSPGGVQLWSTASHSPVTGRRYPLCGEGC